MTIDKRTALLSELMTTLFSGGGDRDDPLVVLFTAIGMHLAVTQQPPPTDEFYAVLRRAVDTSYRLHVRMFAEAEAAGTA